MAKTTKKLKKNKKIVLHWQVHIQASFNNTIVSVTDTDWNVLSWASWGSSWFKWAREATPYAAQITAENAVWVAKSTHSMETVDVYIKWIWVWREQAVRWVIWAWVDLKSIFDVTPVPHNWCRKKKIRKS